MKGNHIVHTLASTITATPDITPHIHAFYTYDGELAVVRALPDAERYVITQPSRQDNGDLVIGRIVYGPDTNSPVIVTCPPDSDMHTFLIERIVTLLRLTLDRLIDSEPGHITNLSTYTLDLKPLADHAPLIETLTLQRRTTSAHDPKSFVESIEYPYQRAWTDKKGQPHVPWMEEILTVADAIASYKFTNDLQGAIVGVTTGIKLVEPHDVTPVPKMPQNKAMTCKAAAKKIEKKTTTKKAK